MEIKIGKRQVGPSHPPFVIAELSTNHNGNIENAFKIIEQAKAAGADAVKLQTYRADTITLESTAEDFMIKDGLWKGQSLFQLYEKASLPWDWHEPLFEYARSLDILIFSTPFDFSAVDMLEKLDAPAYKVASFEATDLPLISYIAATGKPIIISTGMANFDEISEAVEAAKSGGADQIAILHCVSGYPVPLSEYNLNTLSDMRQKFGLVTGLSDHTVDNTCAIASVALGAAIIEKHVTLDKNGGGPDDSFSIEADELRDLCIAAKGTWEALGAVDYGLKSSERGNSQFRRSLYFVADLKAGEIIQQSHVRSVRPGYGLPPKYLPQILGKKLSSAVKRNSPVSWDMIESQ